MTATVNEIAQSLSSSVSVHVDAVVIVTVVILLAEQELIRAYFGGVATARIRPLHALLVPLLAAVVLIIVVRALGLR